MAFSRKFLEALNIPENTVQAIIDEHVATVNGVKTELEAKLAKAQADADKLPGVQKDLDDLRAANFEEKFNAEHTAFEAYKADIEGKAAKAAKEAAVKQYFTDKKIKADSMNLALRATDIDKIELGEDGKIKDAKALDELLAGDLKPLIGDTKKVIDSGAHLGEGGTPANTYNLRDALSDKYGK